MTREELQPNPRVDVVIAVHTPDRPIDRAVGSVLTHTQASVRVTVVVHNTELLPIQVKLSSYEEDARLRIVEFSDGVKSPAGPMNYGLGIATADFTSLLGSDDELAPGAIDRWLDLADSYQAHAVIAGLRFSDGIRVPQPPVRPFGRVVRDPVADRLAYRSAPLGLISTSKFGNLRLTEGVPTGEDLLYSLIVWFSGNRVVYDANDDGYRVHRDGDDRITNEYRPLHVEWQAITELLAHNGHAGSASAQSKLSLDRRSRVSIAVKILRVQILGNLAARGLQERSLTENDRETLVVMRNAIEQFAPASEDYLSLVEHKLLNAATTQSDFTKEAVAWSKKLIFGSVLTKSLTKLFHPQSPFRYGVASYIQLRRR